MKLLLDTCTILWLAANPSQLSKAAHQAIATNPAALFVSTISAFEISLKHRKGQLDLGMDAATWWFRATAHHRLTIFPITDQIALASTALPGLHSDPCDRIIIATAAQHSAAIITSDGLIRQYPSVQVIW